VILQLFSPAKINAALAVVGKAGGFHQLESTVQTVSLGDQLLLEQTPTDRLIVDCADVPTDERNVVFKARALFRQKTGWNQPITVTLKKSIPIEAGLGGGSSNCATVLWGLNQLSGANLAPTELAYLASCIGSDCALFFSSGAATMRGRGEQVQSHPEPLVQGPFWIVKPAYGLSTASVYGALQPSEWSGRLRPDHNDLEAPALRLAPALAQLRHDLMERGFGPVRMTGSGSALICFGNGHEFPEEVRYWKVSAVMRHDGAWYQG
jgi:4-diphosphocytidyl-2-C-methyl-D-erythritol kinase